MAAAPRGKPAAAPTPMATKPTPTPLRVVAAAVAAVVALPILGLLRPANSLHLEEDEHDVTAAAASAMRVEDEEQRSIEGGFFDCVFFFGFSLSLSASTCFSLPSIETTKNKTTTPLLSQEKNLARHRKPTQCPSPCSSRGQPQQLWPRLRGGEEKRTSPLSCTAASAEASPSSRVLPPRPTRRRRAHRPTASRSLRRPLPWTLGRCSRCPLLEGSRPCRTHSECLVCFFVIAREKERARMRRRKMSLPHEQTRERHGN